MEREQVMRVFIRRVIRPTTVAIFADVAPRGHDIDPSRRRREPESKPAAITGEDNPFTHIMTASEPNPFAPFSHELSVEFSRAYDDAEILLSCATCWSLGDSRGGAAGLDGGHESDADLLDHPRSTGRRVDATLEGSTISASMAIDGARRPAGRPFRSGVSAGIEGQLKSGIGTTLWFIEKGVLDLGFKAGYSFATTPVDIEVSRSTSRHFDIGISFSTAISTSDSPYLAGQPSDVIIGGGANLRFISAIEIYAKETDSVNGGLCFGGLTRNSSYGADRHLGHERLRDREDDRAHRRGADRPEHEDPIKEGVPNPHTDLPKQIENWQDRARELPSHDEQGPGGERRRSTPARA